MWNLFALQVNLSRGPFWINLSRIKKSHFLVANKFRHFNKKLNAQWKDIKCTIVGMQCNYSSGAYLYLSLWRCLLGIMRHPHVCSADHRERMIENLLNTCKSTSSPPTKFTDRAFHAICTCCFIARMLVHWPGYVFCQLFMRVSRDDDHSSGVKARHSVRARDEPSCRHRHFLSTALDWKINTDTNFVHPACMHGQASYSLATPIRDFPYPHVHVHIAN